jgi:glycosyltransferase involved in cell wall biosynthesis
MPPSSSRTTVVVPAFNRADFLAETLESALAQTVPPLEIIVVDDASTDGTADVASRFPVTLIEHEKNRGNSDARNTGISQARGEFVAFLDSDDLWAPEHLEYTYDLLKSYPDADLAFTGTKSFGERSAVRPEVIEPFSPRNCYWDLIAGCFVPIQSVVVRRAVFESTGMFESGRRIVEDYEWFLRLSRRSLFVSSDIVTAEYRIHPGQLSKSTRSMIFGDWELLLNERSLLAQGPHAALDLVRFDEITSRRVGEDIANFVYEGDYKSIRSLAQLLSSRGANVQAAEIGTFDEMKAFGRSIFNQLPAVVADQLRASRRAVFSPKAADQSRRGPT